MQTPNKISLEYISLLSAINSQKAMVRLLEEDGSVGSSKVKKENTNSIFRKFNIKA